LATALPPPTTTRGLRTGTIIFPKQWQTDNHGKTLNFSNFDFRFPEDLQSV
jgi:hypothetical protein